MNSPPKNHHATKQSLPATNNLRTVNHTPKRLIHCTLLSSTSNVQHKQKKAVGSDHSYQNCLNYTNFDARALLSNSLDTPMEHLLFHFTDMFTSKFSYRQLKTNLLEQQIHLDHFTLVCFICIWW